MLIYSSTGRREKATPRIASDGGFTLLEPIIAMFVLMLVAVAVLPILTQSLVQSSNNAELVTATSFANQAIEDERAQSSCAALTPLDQSVTVRSNLILRTVRTIDACPTHYPATVKVSVTVTNATSGRLEVSVSTLVLVKSA
ncbi:MAG TPA: type II secretion system protein [Pseudolysinimonas sp.]|nr:type II secretion system protein [Pseudolysinimonas sp.]